MSAAVETTGIRQAASNEASALVDTLAAAFEADPVFGWLIPDARTRRRRLKRFFNIEVRDLALAHGAAWTTPDPIGAALVMSPGHWQLPQSVMLRRGPSYLAAFGRRLPLATAFLIATERKHLREPHYYFAAVGVRPEHQGQGIGSRLMRPTLELCDRERLPAYLEASSADSARLYRRLGFEDIEEFRFSGSPPIWLMARPPRG